MPWMFFSFFFLMMVWLFWAIAWVVVWAVVMLAWPLALLVAGFVLWRTLMRRSQRSLGGRRPRRDSAFHNSAIEDYRQATLRRLDEEHGKFREFLERMRRSKDKQEFDAFMAGRRGRPALPRGDAPAA